MALKELFSRDTEISPRTSKSFGLGSVFDFSANAQPISSDQGSWASPPAGYFLRIQDSPEYFLLIDNSNRLLIA